VLGSLSSVSTCLAAADGEDAFAMRKTFRAAADKAAADKAAAAEKGKQQPGTPDKAASGRKGGKRR
jgi:hypothetical protein